MITIPADPDLLPPALKPFGAAPPLVTDIDLSVDDAYLYVSCWGTGELEQFDVRDPASPKQTAADFRGLRVHQVRLQGGDASSDSYCYR